MRGGLDQREEAGILGVLGGAFFGQVCVACVAAITQALPAIYFARRGRGGGGDDIVILYL